MKQSSILSAKFDCPEACQNLSDFVTLLCMIVKLSYCDLVPEKTSVDLRRRQVKH